MSTMNGYQASGSKWADGYAHIAVAELALGKTLRSDAPVHHVDGDKLNNDPSNLVVCDSARYHNLLHYRQRAMQAIGNADAVYCRYCKQWETDMASVRIRYIGKNKNTIFPAHIECLREYDRERYARNGRRGK